MGAHHPKIRGCTPEGAEGRWDAGTPHAASDNNSLKYNGHVAGARLERSRLVAWAARKGEAEASREMRERTACESEEMVAEASASCNYLFIVYKELQRPRRIVLKGSSVQL